MEKKQSIATKLLQYIKRKPRNEGGNHKLCSEDRK